MNLLKSVVEKAAKELIDKYKMEDVGQMFVGFGTALLRICGKTKEECHKIIDKVWQEAKDATPGSRDT
jgi:hypothetical protein